jgi:glycosyltransferase involved in cell wall biosynthesis
LLVFPATKPHQARPIFEAGLSKIPVIASEFPNIKEFMNDELGFTFQNKNSSDLAKLIKDIFLKKISFKNQIENNFLICNLRHTESTYDKRIKDFIMASV